MGESEGRRCGRLRRRQLPEPSWLCAHHISSDEIDAVAAYCGELDRCFLIPGGLVAGKYMLHLRLGPARNSQRAAINMADDYDLGAIAQLGERSDGIRKVVGSSPTSSISIASPKSSVSADEFRRRFGWYMQRAHAGERFLVTRRGKPYVRLVPAAEPLPLDNQTTEHRRPRQ